MIADFIYFFSNGINQLRVGDVKKARAELADAIVNGNASYFSQLLSNGIKNISKPRYDAITEIFSKYGVQESEVWTVKPV